MKKGQKLTLTIMIAILVSQMIMSVSYAATATVITETLRLRKAPTTDSNILRNLDAGDVVEVISKEGDWYKISFKEYEGYIAAEYVKVDGEVLSDTTKEDEKPNETEQPKDDSGKQDKDVDTSVNTNAPQSNNNGEVKLKANTNVHILPVLISSPIKTTEKVVTIKLLETINNWSNVEVEGITGWVLNKYIENFDSIKNNVGETTETSTTPVEENKEIIESKTGYVNVSSANVRSEASKESKVVKTLVLNNEVKILEDLGEWYKIQNGDGVAYIYASLVSNEKTQITSRSSTNRTSTPVSSEKSAALIASANGNSVAEFAKQYIGYKYVYGGSGPTTFDCSGFTMYVYKQFGINLPHNAVTQSNYGAYVSKSNLVPGDLVIFNNSSNTSIGHSGIYIGNGKIVHAANSKRGVTTDTILSGYYNTRFVEGRRLL